METISAIIYTYINIKNEKINPEQNTSWKFYETKESNVSSPEICSQIFDEEMQQEMGINLPNTEHILKQIETNTSRVIESLEHLKTTPLCNDKPSMLFTSMFEKSSLQKPSVDFDIQQHQLDLNLERLGLKRQPISSDGNCLFESVIFEMDKKNGDIWRVHLFIAHFIPQYD